MHLKQQLQQILRLYLNKWPQEYKKMYLTYIWH